LRVLAFCSFFYYVFAALISPQLLQKKRTSAAKPHCYASFCGTAEAVPLSMTVETEH
jgi:hypothetical protein